MASMADNGARVREAQSHAKRVSTHIAYALVVYTLVLIFAVSPQMESKGMSILPYFLLVALVGAVIPPCRNLERRWQRFDNDIDASHDATYRRDLVVLWLCAFGLPLMLTAILWIIP
jgi:hypothetical protein